MQIKRSTGLLAKRNRIQVHCLRKQSSLNRRYEWRLTATLRWPLRQRSLASLQLNRTLDLRPSDPRRWSNDLPLRRLCVELDGTRSTAVVCDDDSCS
ncbi:hypothetical protein SCHPADRAFT_473576 [Schizopora paradoxa]|uniref:Uncharacterized protein n=1 Tax=Schizopora paradoxa TaxID=27342 RepID=A0A0H2RPH5_9AGAM|nr:hypothetical protein SCHPADRAFT_473576 [Schizopora paradoxa]